MIVDGVLHPKSLIDMIMDTQKTTNPNNVIQFSDNSSAIKGYPVKKMMPTTVTEPSSFDITEGTRHIIFTAETHNFPTGVAPFRYALYAIRASSGSKRHLCINYLKSDTVELQQEREEGSVTFRLLVVEVL
jgi:hypothetical protein